jgi:proteasome alpha subunit
MFGGQGRAYDRALTVFSPEGRLFQVEYALEAVRRGTLAVAVKSKDDVCLVAQIKVASKLMDANSIDKIFQIDEHVGVAISGLHADSRALINYARVQAQSFRLTYDEPVRLNMLAKTIADMKQQYTQFGGVRPWGCAFFLIGIDAAGTHIYTTSPEYLIDNYKAEMPFEEVISTAIAALKEAIDEEATKENVRIAYIKGETKKFHMASKEEIEGFLVNSV